MNFVFDSSALIAYLEAEDGAQTVDSLLIDPSNNCYVHAINLCEVFYNVHRQYGEQSAIESHNALLAAGLILCEDMDEEFWQDAGRIKADYRRVSLADCMCIALTNRVDGVMVTSDRHEIEVIAEAGVCRVQFIR